MAVLELLLVDNSVTTPLAPTSVLASGDTHWMPTARAVAVS